MSLSILAFLVNFLSFFVFAFVLWRRLREDYPNNKIFLLTLGLVGSMVVGNWVFGRWPYFSFWASLLLGVSIGAYLVKKLDMRLFEVVDAVAPAWFWFLMLGGPASPSQSGLTGFLSTRAPGALVEPAMAGVALLGFTLFNARYRTFSWYPSGKIGFAGLAALALYFLSRFIFGVYIALTSSLIAGVFSVIIGLVLFLGGSFVIYFRGREQV